MDKQILNTLLFITFLCSNVAFGQTKKIINYHFKVKYPSYSDGGLYFGQEYEFNSIREYNSDSTFIDEGIFDNNLGYEFKKDKNNKWYIKLNDEWVLFFNQDIKFIGTIQIAGIPYSIHWSHASFWKGGRNYIFRLVPPKNMNVSHLPTFIFNRENGIIGIENNGLLLLREDMMNEIN